jgi:membrane protein DedA with SNARE-associated domain
VVREGLLQEALALFSRYGLLFLFVASLAENLFIIGFIIPGDLIIVLGGGLAARAGLPPVSAALAAVAGVLIGSNLSFWVGRRGGSVLIERWGERFGIGEKRVKLAEAYFASHGAKTVFVGSFISGLKNLVPAVAGASRMGFVRFAAYSAVGSTVRSVALVAVGYLCGANLERALHVAGSINGWVLGVMGAAVIAALAHHFAKKRRTAREGGAKGQDRVDGEAAP